MKPEPVATFLGKKLHPRFQDELGSRLDLRLPGMRIKHTRGPVA